MRLVLVHGFTQTGRSWGEIAEGLRDRGHEVVCPDLPGHGERTNIRADLKESAALLAAAVGPAPAVWVGYSLGGRVCLHLDAANPHAEDRHAANLDAANPHAEDRHAVDPEAAHPPIRGLVLVSATAGIDDDAEREQRRHADDALADEIEPLGTGPFLERWLQGPLWATLPREAAGIQHRLANSPRGLASSLRLCGTGTQTPLWAQLDQIRLPVLVVTGDADPKFTTLGDRIAAAIGPNATRVRRPGVGHAVPWEHPEAFVALLDTWLEGLNARSR